MKFGHLILANLLRKKIRTALTIGSFAVALFLFGILATVRSTFRFHDVAGADRLLVVNKVSLTEKLPLSYRDRLLRIPGVQQVSFSFGFPVYYQNERNFFVAGAIDVENERAMFPEFIIPDDQWAAFVADREGCIVGEALAKKFHWKMGDRIPIKRFLGTWEFNLRGIYRGKRPQDDTNRFWIQWKYYDEKMNGKGEVRMYTVRVVHPDQAARVVKAIDQEFANSPWETRTSTESDFAASIVNMAGNVEFLILSVGSVVFFTLLLVAGNTMAIAVRERVSELAVMKAVGFSDLFVLLLVLIESLVVAALGGALGLGLAKMLTWKGGPTIALLPPFYLPGKALASGLALALLVGVASAMLPALSAMRLRVVDALRRV